MDLEKNLLKVAASGSVLGQMTGKVIGLAGWILAGLPSNLPVLFRVAFPIIRIRISRRKRLRILNPQNTNPKTESSVAHEETFRLISAEPQVVASIIRASAWRQLL
jgi:hypothetical protein